MRANSLLFIIRRLARSHHCIYAARIVSVRLNLEDLSIDVPNYDDNPSRMAVGAHKNENSETSNSRQRPSEQA